MIAFPRHASNICADIDVPVACRGITSRTDANCRIVAQVVLSKSAPSPMAVLESPSVFESSILVL